MPPPRPRQRSGLLTGLNPLTLFGALIPAMVMIFALKEPSLNVIVLASASLLMVAALLLLRFPPVLRVYVNPAPQWILQSPEKFPQQPPSISFPTWLRTTDRKSVV